MPRILGKPIATNARPEPPRVRAGVDRLATRAGFLPHGRNGTP